MTHPSTAVPPPAPPAASGPCAADPAPPSGGPSGSLAKGQIGTFDLVFFVVAAAAPLTVLAGVAPFAIGIGGPGTPLGYLVSGALLVLFAAGFTAMSRYVRNAGAFYAYVARGSAVPSASPRPTWRRSRTTSSPPVSPPGSATSPRRP
ncbi:hypothetical protein ACFQ2K_14330 [Streptomyces sanglieri]|uniref:Amino acid permease n=1 Tax=Streptomyces sanglieri TaxID=193460 RepID=A0ABW2WSZ6_9ACTN